MNRGKQKPGILGTYGVNCGCGLEEEPGCAPDPLVLMDRAHDLHCPVGKPFATQMMNRDFVFSPCFIGSHFHRNLKVCRGQ